MMILSFRWVLFQFNGDNLLEKENTCVTDTTESEQYSQNKMNSILNFSDQALCFLVF